MERILLLPMLLAVVISHVTPECLDGNCTEPLQFFPLNIGSLFNFFPPDVEYDGEGDKELIDDAIDAPNPFMNKSIDDGVVSFNVRVSMVSFGNPANEESSEEDKMPSLFRQMMDNIISNIGILDLSGRTMTSDELYDQLKRRWNAGQPVTNLILSNSRVYPMDAGTFAIAEGTIHTLQMDNSSVNLDALRGFTNLRVLNLSNNGLSTFPWYGLMKDTLEVLDLSHNNFEEIRPELSMLKNLKNLDLSYNKIVTVPEAPLSLMPNLEVLDLSMNMLQRDVNFESLTNLKQLELDWNFLDGFTQLRLPSQRLKLKIASNPWGCDCNLIKMRDNNDVLDLDQVQCADHQVYGYCDGCPRAFLPLSDSPDIQLASNLTKEGILHRRCNDIPELYYSFVNGYYKLRDNEPEKLVGDIILVSALTILVIVAVLLMCKKCCCKKSTISNVVNQNENRKFWLKVQKFHHLSFDKIGKPQEVPYIKIDEPTVKV